MLRPIIASQLVNQQIFLSLTNLSFLLPLICIFTVLPAASTTVPTQIVQNSVYKHIEPPSHLLQNNHFRHPSHIESDSLLHSPHRRMAHGCRHFCSVSDPHSEACWNDTLHFYEQMVVGLIRRLIGTETNRVFWRKANHHRLHSAGIDYAQLTQESLHRFMALAQRPQRVEDANSWKRADLVFERLCPAIMENVRLLVEKLLHDHYGNAWPRLNVECPHGCERSWETWKWLCIGSLLITVLLSVAVFCLAFMLDHNEQNAWTLEATEYNECVKMVPSSMDAGNANQQQQQQNSSNGKKI